MSHSHMLSRLFILAVRLYQVMLGPWLGGHCRFQPTCSQYMIEAIHKHGPLGGVRRGIQRIGRCHPWGGFGFDPP
jgi:putative membrane protein insertion efficiency factor